MKFKASSCCIAVILLQIIFIVTASDDLSGFMQATIARVAIDLFLAAYIISLAIESKNKE